LFPDLKIVYLLRNPIDQIWSTICYRDKKDRKNITNAKIDELKTYVNRSQITSRSNYLQTLNLWKKYFPEKQLFVGFYEDIINRPEDSLIDVLNFLEANITRKGLNNFFSGTVNALASKKKPCDFKKNLVEQYLSQIEQLMEIL